MNDMQLTIISNGIYEPYTINALFMMEVTAHKSFYLLFASLSFAFLLHFHETKVPQNKDACLILWNISLFFNMPFYFFNIY